MMQTIKAYLRVAFGLSLLVLAGCATHTWAPGPDAKGTFEEANAQCQLMARHSGGSYYASGTPSFVAGATAGAAIGEAIRTQADYNDCMAASGWQVADSKSGNAAAANNASVKTAGDEMKACMAVVTDDPKYAPIAPQMRANGATHFTLVQLSNGNIPTAQEASLLATYEDNLDTCRDKFLSEVSAINPRGALALQQVRTNTRNIEILLIQRKITWGEAAQRTEAIMDSAQASFASGHS